LTRTTFTFNEDQFTFFIISRSLVLRMRNVSDIICRGNQNTHFVFSNLFLGNRTVYEIMWKNIVEQGRPHAHCVLDNSGHTHSLYVILIAFPLQQWLHKRASMLRYAWIACLIYTWLHCPALTAHRLECFGFVWLDPTDIARFSIKVALTMAW